MFWGSLIVILAAGVGALVYATPYGPGLINDSVVYIGGAENILAGNGYSRTSGGGEIKPLTVNVPLYSYTLAAVAKTGVDLIKAGWLTSLACFVLNGFLAAWLTLRLTRSKTWAVLAALLVATSESVLRAHTFALSEPEFITLMLASLLLITYGVERKNWYFPAAAGALVSLAYMTRYIGLSLLATGIAAFFVFSKTWRERLVKIGLFLPFSLLGGILWFARNLAVSGNAANRSLLYHPLTTDKLQEGAQTLMTFLFPERFNLYDKFPALFNTLAVLVIFALVAQVYLFWKNAGKVNEADSVSERQIAFIVAIQTIFYFVVLLLSLTFLDASTALENRQLVPSFICLILLVVYLLYRLEQRGGWQSWLALGLTAVILLAGAYDGRRAVIDLHADGQGYASAYYRNSQTIDALKRMPPMTIWTNRVPAVNLLADRPAYALLAPIDPLTRQKRPNYDSSLKGIRQTVLNGDTILVVFEAKQVLDDPVEGQWLKDLTKDIPPVFESDDGMIFAVQK
jgi:hypothetical protein